MKIVDRKAFLALPSGTLFSKYEPCVFGELSISCGQYGDNDFLVQTIADAIEQRNSGDYDARLQGAEENGESLPMDFDLIGRDGLYDDEQLFAAWEAADVEALISRLRSALRQSKGAEDESDPPAFSGDVEPLHPQLIDYLQSLSREQDGMGMVATINPADARAILAALSRQPS